MIITRAPFTILLYVETFYMDMSDSRYAIVDSIYQLTKTKCKQLTHGSFTYILSTLGQQALELQLERFFTPWAWSWDLEDGHDFGEHLGICVPPHEMNLQLTLP